MAKVHGITYSSGKTPPNSTSHDNRQGAKIIKFSHGNSTFHDNRQKVKIIKFSHGQLSILKFKLSNKESLHICDKSNSSATSHASSFLCRSREIKKTETEECEKHYSKYSDTSSTCQGGKGQYVHSPRIVNTNQALAEACKFAYNDAKYVNERARKDIVLLSRGIMRLDTRARQDVAILGSGFLKLDARAREDTEKIDNGVKRRAEHLHHIASKLKNKAQSTLKSAADRHWSDGALEADLRWADYIAKQRAMEDALMALEFIKDVLDMMVSRMYKLKNTLYADEMAVQITLEKNGKGLYIFTGEVSADRINAIQEAYWDVASALSEADGIDYTDPEELELLVATLMDLDAMDGKGSASLLAECSNSPDVNTRKALANALSVAPSLWTLGNAGMGALQRLAEDINPTIAAAASKTISELKRQWEIEEGDSYRFMMNQIPAQDVDYTKSDDNNHQD